jgi:hypothetical protein
MPMTPEKEREISAEYIRECVIYDPLTGLFTWRHRPLRHFMSVRSYNMWNAKHAGREPSRSVNSRGYMGIMINKTKHQAHRIAWLYMTGGMPKLDVDHIDGIKTNNKFENLRLATRAENGRNRGHNKNSAIGIKGVHWSKSNKRWISQIGKGRKKLYLGSFENPEDASYIAAAKELHGEFARIV